MKNRLLLLCLVAGFAAHGQTGSLPKHGSHATDSPKMEYFNYVEEMPRQRVDVNKYVQTNLHYPALARQNKVQGRVLLKFIVNEDGSIADVQVVKGLGSGCDEEAIRLVSALPKWIPAKQNGKAVKVYYNLPIDFKLADTSPVNTK